MNILQQPITVILQDLHKQYHYKLSGVNKESFYVEVSKPA